MKTINFSNVKSAHNGAVAETPSPAKTKDLPCKSKFLLPLPQGERGKYFRAYA
jgi:hypothetical protein